MAYHARKPVQLDQDQQILVDALKSVVSKLNSNDSNFAESLIKNFFTWGRLSDKQLHWVDVLTQRANTPVTPQIPVQQVNVRKIQDLFTVASKKLRRVKVAVSTDAGQKVVFARAGSASKYSGQILVTDGGPFGANKFFGRIDHNGDFFSTRSADNDVQNLVKEFADDPSLVAGKYGKLTGGCSFCNRKLDDNRSLKLGYGPVCAQRFNLSWG
jgi:hypothetical protein